MSDIKDDYESFVEMLYQNMNECIPKESAVTVKGGGVPVDRII